jgi:hypothetical protein
MAWSTLNWQKQNRNKSETTVDTQPTKHKYFVDISVFCPAHILRTATVDWYIMWRFRSSHMYGCGWVYIPRIQIYICIYNVCIYIYIYIHIHIHKGRCFWMTPALSKRKVFTYTSVPYPSLHLLNPCTRQTAKDPYCRDIYRRVVKLATKQEHTDL